MTKSLLSWIFSCWDKKSKEFRLTYNDFFSFQHFRRNHRKICYSRMHQYYEIENNKRPFQRLEAKLFYLLLKQIEYTCACWRFVLFHFGNLSFCLKSNDTNRKLCVLVQKNLISCEKAPHSRNSSGFKITLKKREWMRIKLTDKIRSKFHSENCKLPQKLWTTHTNSVRCLTTNSNSEFLLDWIG